MTNESQSEQLTFIADAPAEIETAPARIPISEIGVDPEVYPRHEIDDRRAERYAAVMRDGVQFPQIHVEVWPHTNGDEPPKKYRVLDGAHTWTAYKKTGYEGELDVILVSLNGYDPLLYAASRAIGPTELKEADAKETARRAYQKNPKLTETEIARAVGRSQGTVSDYISDLRAAIKLEREIKVFRMGLLGIPQERIADRLKETREWVRDHLANLSESIISPKADLSRGFPVNQVATKHEWPEPLVWAVALQEKTDQLRFQELKWPIRTWDYWNWNDVDARFGDEWPGRIPAQLVAHALYFFTKPGDLVFDPMAGGGVVPDVCLALNRQCWAFDMVDRPDTRPEIEPYHWAFNNMAWPVNAKAKPDLIFFDPPYFTKKEEAYEGLAEGSAVPISSLSRADYLAFFREFFLLCAENTKSTTRLAFLNADWRDFQSTPALNESPKDAITIRHYWNLLEETGWEVTHRIECPMSTERFSGNMVSHMQANRTIGVIGRTLLIARRR